MVITETDKKPLNYIVSSFYCSKSKPKFMANKSQQQLRRLRTAFVGFGLRSCLRAECKWTNELNYFWQCLWINSIIISHHKTRMGGELGAVGQAVAEGWAPLSCWVSWNVFGKQHLQWQQRIIHYETCKRRVTKVKMFTTNFLSTKPKKQLRAR